MCGDEQVPGAHTPPAPQFPRPQVGITGAATWLPRLSPGLGVPQSRGSSWESWCRKAATNGPPGRRRGESGAIALGCFLGAGTGPGTVLIPRGPGRKGPAGGDGAVARHSWGAPTRVRDTREPGTASSGKGGLSAAAQTRTVLGCLGGSVGQVGSCPRGPGISPASGPRPSGTLLLPPLELSVCLRLPNK